MNHKDSGSPANFKSYFGWDCSRDQARFSNSHNSGYTMTTQAPITRSKGNPSWKSDASKNPDAMDPYWNSQNTSGYSALNTTNYGSNFKWGNAIGTKWTDGWSGLTEKGGSYEGEKILFEKFYYN